MVSLTVFFVIAAVVCWILATFGVGSRFNLIAAGLALCGLAYIFGSFLK
jgi:hypothetical protein